MNAGSQLSQANEDALKLVGWTHVLFMALLAIAMGAVWAPLGSGAANLHADVAHHQADAHSDHLMDTHDHRGLAEPQPDCRSSGPICCLMAICHPGLMVDPIDVAFLGVCSEKAQAGACAVSASDPGVAVPPPRRLLV